MKITFIGLTEKAIEERDYCNIYVIEIDGKEVFNVYDGEPEDNNMSRNFNDVYKLQSVLEAVYEAGKRGEDLEIENVVVTV